jgi:natural resistance-associated macrophage protein
LQGGYTLLWVLFWSTAIGNLLQILAARLGVVTGKNLAEVRGVCALRWIGSFHFGDSPDEH